MEKNLKGFGLLLMVSIISFALVACTSTAAPTEAVAPEGTFTVHPIMLELYNQLGGVKILGPAISEKFTHNGKHMQYTENGLLVIDPNDNSANRYALANIGLKLDIYESPRLPEPGEFVVDGYPIQAEFVALYDQITPRFTGKPLTNPRYNPEKQRIEQYFENVAFFLPLDTPDGNPGLLSYGSYDCDFACRYQPMVNKRIEGQYEIPPPFTDWVERLGQEFVGVKTDHDPYMANDGNPEMVFTNLVLYEDANANRVFARPVAVSLGFTRPAIENNGSYSGTFYAIYGSKGYYVADIMSQYLSYYGGFDILGLPISNPFFTATGMWQCFENGCLIYDASLKEGYQVYVAALGELYYQITYGKVAPPSIVTEESTTINTANGFTFSANEDFPVINSNVGMRINVDVSQFSKPAANVVPRLKVTYPSQITETFIFTPTDLSGMSTFTLPPISVSEDTLIEYAVCIDNACITDAFLVLAND